MEPVASRSNDKFPLFEVVLFVVVAVCLAIALLAIAKTY